MRAGPDREPHVVCMGGSSESSLTACEHDVYSARGDSWLP